MSAAMNVLIVDDHKLVAEGMRMMMTMALPGARTTVCHTIADATAATGPFQLVMLDLGLPDANGFEGLERMREAHPAAIITMVSADDTPANIAACIERGALGFIAKSSGPDVLYAALQRLGAGEGYLPEHSLQIQGAQQHTALTAPSTVGHGVHASPTTGHEHATALLAKLSPRQRTVLLSAIQGKTNKTIAVELGITPHTVKDHLNIAFQTLGVHGRTQAVYFLTQHRVNLTG
jgi:DNA-binding NarL/FixJ family response regulator